MLQMTPRVRRQLCFAAALVGVFFTARAPAQGPLTGASERFATLQPVRVKTLIKASSDPDDRPTSRSHGNDDGFTGVNGAEAFRETAFGIGTDYAILADVQGREGFMGLFFKNFWSGAVGVPINAIEDNIAELLVDGVVAHSHPLSEYFRNVNDPAGQVPPFVGTFTASRSGGHLTHTPILFQRSFKLRVLENSFQNAGRFHKVALTLADPEGGIEVPDLAQWEQVLARRGGWRHNAPRIATTRRMDIPPSGSRRVVFSGPGAILEVRVRVDDIMAWDHLDARFRFDGKPGVGVDVPLRMLGAAGSAPYQRGFDSLLMGNDGTREIWCYFPMPFRESATLEIVNRSTTDEYGVDFVAARWRGQYPEPWGYFTATWNQSVTQFAVPFRGPRLTNCRGMLRGLVLEDTVDTSGRIPPNTDLAHLEGDLCVRINGLRGDEHTFAATETSIGKWGWYLTGSDLPFADASFSTSLNIAYPGINVIGVNRRQGSTYVTDPIQFVDGIDIVLEHGVQNTSNADYGLMALLYVQPGAARELIGELDVGDVTSEAVWGAQFGIAPASQVTTSFFRDQYYGDPMLADEIREVQDWYRFTISNQGLDSYEALGIGMRLDRMRTGSGGVCQARVYVDGYFAGLMHAYTTNPLEHWKEGGETEIEFPKVLTAGKLSMVVEIRPVPGTSPLRIGAVRVHGYTRN